MPKKYTAELPKPVKLKEDFAEYEASTEMDGGVMVTKRHLVIKTGAIAPAQIASYKAFQKAISDDQYNYIQLNELVRTASGPSFVPGTRGSNVWQKSFNELPSSTNSGATEAESKARDAGRTGDLTSALAAMKGAVELDPKFARAWIGLGGLYFALRQKQAAIESLQKAVEAEPKQAVTYKILALAYLQNKDRDQAIHTWQQLQAISPEDHDIAPSLGALYMEGKRYKEAGAIYQTWVKNDPSDGYAYLNLGMAQLRLDEKEQGLAALQKALELQPGAEMLNGVAWEMVEANTNLTQALEYSKRSIEQIEEASRAIDLKNLRPDDLQVATKLKAYWDTLGWIYYKMGNLAKAENYLIAAWQLAQDGDIGDHLGQVYEKEHKLAEAAHTYALALGADPKMEDTAARLHKLSNVPLPPNRMGAGEELSRMRTTSLPRVTKDTASADFYVLFAPGGKLKDSSFHRGSELLRFADGDLAKISFKVPFPADSSAYILRKAILSCHTYSGCTFVFYPINDVANSN